MHCNIGCKKKFMQYKFMWPVLDSHNLHQYSSSHVYINLTHKFVTLGYVKIMVSCGKGRHTYNWCSREEVGMVAALLEVHHDVEQRDWLSTTSVQLLKVTSQDPSIVLPGKYTQRKRTNVPYYALPMLKRSTFDAFCLLLHCTQLNTNNEFSLGRYVL